MMIQIQLELRIADDDPNSVFRRIASAPFNEEVDEDLPVNYDKFNVGRYEYFLSKYQRDCHFI